MALRARIAQTNLDELGEWIAAAVPGLAEAVAREVIERVALGRKGLSMLQDYLRRRAHETISQWPTMTVLSRIYSTSC